MGSAPLETGWRRDEIGRWPTDRCKPAGIAGRQRWWRVSDPGPTSFTADGCRVIALVTSTGFPEPGEQPADLVDGLVHGVAPDTTVAEFD